MQKHRLVPARKTFAFREELKQLKRRRGASKIHYDGEEKCWKAVAELQAEIVECTQGSIQLEGLPPLPWPPVEEGHLGYECMDSSTGRVYDIRRDVDWHEIHKFKPGTRDKDGAASNQHLACIGCGTMLVTRQGHRPRLLALHPSRQPVVDPCLRCRRAAADPDADEADVESGPQERDDSIDHWRPIIDRALEREPHQPTTPGHTGLGEPHHSTPQSTDASWPPTANHQPDPPAPVPDPTPTRPPARISPPPEPALPQRSTWPWVAVGVTVVVLIFVIAVVWLVWR